MPIDCHVPIAVRLVGEPTPAQLEQLGRELARTVAARVAQVERILAERHRFEARTAPPVRERYEPGRDAANARGGAQVPSYDSGGRPVTVPVRGAPTAPAARRYPHGPRFEDRVLLEAKAFLKIDSRRDLAWLRRVVDWYADTVDYQAFTQALRRDGLESFFLGLQARQTGAARPAPSTNLSADTIRMLYGPTPEDPDHWRSLTFEERRAPITVGDRTHLTVRDRTEVIEGRGDQANTHVVVHEHSWEMTPQALHAFLVRMVGGRLTPFEEYLVANWNEVRPVPQFDGPHIVGYYTVSGGSGRREHRIHDANGDVADFWISEAALVDKGLGPIEYLLLGRAAVKLGSLALRAGARALLSGASSAYVRNTLLALRLTTRRLGRPLGAAMEGTEAGMAVPGIGAGRPVAALTAREASSAGVPVPPRGSPAAAVPRASSSTAPRTVVSGGDATASVARQGGTAPPAAPRAQVSPRTASPRATAPEAAGARAGADARAGRTVARVVAVTTVDRTGTRRVTGTAATPGAPGTTTGFRAREEAARVVTGRGTSMEAQVMGERGMHVETMPNRSDARRRENPDTSSSRQPAVAFADRVQVSALENGLPTGTMGELTPADLNTGTSSAHDVNPVGQQPEGVARYGARKGHLLANVMGGSGRDLGNLAWMHVLVNNSSYKTAFENPVIKALRAGHNVRFGVRPKFRGPEVAPYEIEVWATTETGQVVVPVRNIRTPGLSDLSHNPAE
ncbi:DNA/RNA non-specific endonuclease [Streptomyces sp. NPDC002680]|uniref:DNA/RNA non-specific endonuclease n=1 Tax=Streptomyces sp. NPDC002680 TaxID=3364659 RepID=UPI0036CD173C